MPLTCSSISGHFLDFLAQLRIYSRFFRFQETMILQSPSQSVLPLCPLFLHDSYSYQKYSSRKSLIEELERVPPSVVRKKDQGHPSYPLPSLPFPPTPLGIHSLPLIPDCHKQCQIIHFCLSVCLFPFFLGKIDISLPRKLQVKQNLLMSLPSNWMPMIKHIPHTDQKSKIKKIKSNHLPLSSLSLILQRFLKQREAIQSSVKATLLFAMSGKIESSPKRSTLLSPFSLSPSPLCHPPLSLSPSPPIYKSTQSNSHRPNSNSNSKNKFPFRK
ncbi:hypothetical protein ONS95_001317 [Cadophora gregata]|uniref:uncharacterized protein n=1 Tax=Cadophora gregata TaxID=51156 RepID=UPI0026DBF5E7|nr:uncharacterized protein ONS95_001317 [Cadophora gregata]KAK0129391.1 hypothetical protein ONS95_001317 [Cadophora gregata]